MSHYLAGQFVSNVLPTTIGGDVLRVSRLSATRRVARHLRLGGAGAADGVAGAAGHHHRRLPRQPRAAPPRHRHPVALALAVSTLLCWSACWPRPPAAASAGASHLGRLAPVRGRHPPGRRPAAPHPGAAANVLVAGFAYQLALVLAAVAAAQALGLRPPPGLTALLAFFPAVLIAQVLPISMSGLGVREGAFVLFLGPARRGHEEAIALGLLLYLLNLAVSLLGAPAFAAGGRRRRQPGARHRRRRPAPRRRRRRRRDRATGPPAPHRRPGRLGLRWWREVIYIVLVYVGLLGGAEPVRLGRRRRSTPTRRSTTPRPSSSSSGTSASTSRTAAAVVPRPAPQRADPLLERLLRRLPLRGRRLRPGDAVPEGAERYRVWRNTLAFTTLLALVGFATFSLMPPRLLDDPGIYGGCPVYAGADPACDPDQAGEPPCDEFGYVDTVAVYGGWASFGSDEMAAVSNQYAAMPSMHIGWSTWCAWCWPPLMRRRWLKALAIAYPFFTLFDIMVTGNHYWIDGLGGLACLAVGYLIWPGC